MYYNAGMERRRADLVVTDLAISQDKAAYVLSEKRVSEDDMREVLALSQRFFVRQGEAGPEYSALGPSLSGRYLTIAIAPLEEEGYWRLITAYWLDERRGRRLYEGGVN
jgi:hypothetical protein